MRGGPSNILGGLDDFVLITDPLLFNRRMQSPRSIEYHSKSLVGEICSHWANLATNQRRLGNSPKSGADCKASRESSPRIPLHNCRFRNDNDTLKLTAKAPEKWMGWEINYIVSFWGVQGPIFSGANLLLVIPNSFQGMIVICSKSLKFLVHLLSKSVT